jgi:hypothetical protein
MLGGCLIATCRIELPSHSPRRQRSPRSKPALDEWSLKRAHKDEKSNARASIVAARHSV